LKTSLLIYPGPKLVPSSTVNTCSLQPKLDL